MDPHRRAERRSLAYHRRIAERIASEPETLNRARSRVGTWQRTGQVHARYCAVWAQVLALPMDELKAALVAETEAMTAARQCTPFAGALSARERWTLWRSIEP